MNKLKQRIDITIPIYLLSEVDLLFRKLNQKGVSVNRSEFITFLLINCCSRSTPFQLFCKSKGLADDDIMDIIRSVPFYQKSSSSDEPKLDNTSSQKITSLDNSNDKLVSCKVVIPHAESNLIFRG